MISLGLRLAFQIMLYTFRAIKIAREALMAGYQLYLSKEACNPLVSRKLIDVKRLMYVPCGRRLPIEHY